MLAELLASENHKDAFRCLPGEKQQLALPQVDFDRSLRDVGYLLSGQTPEECVARRRSVLFPSNFSQK